MNIKDIPNYIAIIASTIAHIIAANLFMMAGRVHKELFLDMDAELPLITSLLIGYSSTGLPTYVGLVLGLLFMVILVFLYRSPRLLWLFPIGLTISFVTSLLLIYSALLAFTLPYLRITSTMGN